MRLAGSALRVVAAGEPANYAGYGVELVCGKNLGLTIDGRCILENIDIAIHAGEIVTLIGPQGAGKTALARLLLGAIAPSAGTVQRLPSLRLGYVPQRFRLDSAIPLTVRRFLTLGLRHSLPAVRSALQEVGARDLIDRQISTLSATEFQRVCLARALAGMPKLLVLDELAEAIDQEGRTQLYELTAQIRRRRGCGILLISQDLHLVPAVSDRIICLDGRIRCTGTPETVAHRPEIARLFGPEAEQGLAIYRHQHRHD